MATPSPKPSYMELPSDAPARKNDPTAQLPPDATAYKKDPTVELVDMSAIPPSTSLPAGSHDEPLLGMSGKKKESRVSKNVTWASIVKSSREIGHTHIFAYLTILSGVMVLINIIQAALIDQYHSMVWFLGVPLIIFVLAIAVIVGLVLLNPARFLKQWRAAETQKRVAWIGIVLSIVISLALCQFYYLPFVALPQWYETKWTDDVDIPQDLVIPAMVIAWSGAVKALNFSALSCNFPKYNTAVQGDPCSSVPIMDYDVQPGGSQGQYVLLNSTSFVPNVPAQSRAGIQTLNIWNLTVEYDCSILRTAEPPQITIGLFDASLSFNISEMLYGCGNPPLYYVTSSAASLHMNFEVSAAANRLDDQIGALRAQAPPTTNAKIEWCTPETLALSQYEYFTASYGLNPADAGGVLNATCGGNGTRAPAPALLQGSLTMSTATVITQTSAHGTDPLKILLDESAILGAVAFFAWFFSIFAV